jgi:hypothetical protein
MSTLTIKGKIVGMHLLNAVQSDITRRGQNNVKSRSHF